MRRFGRQPSQIRSLVRLAFALLALVGLQPTALGQALACPSVAVLSGDPGLVESTSALLRGRGISTAAQSGCPHLSAVLLPVQSRLVVTVSNESGDLETEVLSDTAVAATLIESWLASDLETPYLDPPIAWVTADTAGLGPPLEAPAPATALAERAAPPEVERPLLYFGSIQEGFGFADDGSKWIDVTASGCTILGPICVGVAIRGTFDLGISGAAADVDGDRLGLDMFLLGELPLRVGDVTLIPALALGAGWIRSGGESPDQRGRVDTDKGGVCGEASFRVAVPLSHTASLELGAAATLSPLAPATAADGDVTLAGSPFWQVRSVVGLRFGAP